MIKNDLKKEFNEQNYINIVEYDSPIFKKNTDSINKTIENSLFSISPNHVIHPEVILQKALKESLILRSITPIELSERPTAEESFQLFQMERGKNINKKDLKKIFKKFASMCHPDKVSSMNLPRKYLDISHTNFIKIKIAYETIKKEIGSK